MADRIRKKSSFHFKNLQVSDHKLKKNMWKCIFDYRKKSDLNDVCVSIENLEGCDSSSNFTLIKKKLNCHNFINNFQC